MPTAGCCTTPSINCWWCGDPVKVAEAQCGLVVDARHRRTRETPQPPASAFNLTHSIRKKNCEHETYVAHEVRNDRWHQRIEAVAASFETHLSYLLFLDHGDWLGERRQTQEPIPEATPDAVSAGKPPRMRSLSCVARARVKRRPACTRQRKISGRADRNEQVVPSECEIDAWDLTTGKAAKAAQNGRATCAPSVLRNSSVYFWTSQVFRTIVMLAMHNLDLGYKDARRRLSPRS